MGDNYSEGKLLGQEVAKIFEPLPICKTKDHLHFLMLKSYEFVDTDADWYKAGLKDVVPIGYAAVQAEVYTAILSKVHANLVTREMQECTSVEKLLNCFKRTIVERQLSIYETHTIDIPRRDALEPYIQFQYRVEQYMASFYQPVGKYALPTPETSHSTATVARILVNVLWKGQLRHYRHRLRPITKSLNRKLFSGKLDNPQAVYNFFASHLNDLK